LKFTAYYINKKQDKILGVAVMGIPNATQIVNEAIKHGVMPKAS
jgi:orotate phosphoribosyltransferase-like protein